MTKETLQKANELDEKIEELHLYTSRIDQEIKLMLDDHKRELRLSVNNDSVCFNNVDGLCLISHIKQAVERRLIDYEHQLEEL